MNFWSRWMRAYVGLLWDLDGWLGRLWWRRRVRISGSCEACGECCRRLVLWTDGRTVRSQEDFQQLVQRDEFTYSRFQPAGTSAEGDLLFRCSKLGEDNRCTVHADRPVLCRRYPEPRMFLQGGRLPEECSYQVTVQIREIH